MTERPCSGASDPRSRVPRRDGPETSGDGRPAQSRSIEHRLTQGARHSDPGKADLDAHGLDRVHLLGNSPGVRVVIELACRRRALSVVSISPCGLGAPLERAHQGRGDDHHPNDQPGSLSLAGRVGPHPRRPVRPTRRDARHAVAGLPSRCAHHVKDGFADQTGFWTTLWNAIMIDVPTRPGPHQLPGHRRAGRDGCHRFRADPAVRPGDSRCPASRRSAPIRVGSRPHRQHGLTSDSAPQRSPGGKRGHAWVTATLTGYGTC